MSEPLPSDIARRSFLGSLAALMLPWGSQKPADGAAKIHYGVTCGTLTRGGNCEVKRIDPGTKQYTGVTDAVDTWGNEIGKGKTIAYAETDNGMVAMTWMV